jgi:hypothetical protein
MLCCREQQFLDEGHLKHPRAWKAFERSVMRQLVFLEFESIVCQLVEAAELEMVGIKDWLYRNRSHVCPSDVPTTIFEKKE